MTQLIQEHGLEDVVECDAMGTRNYNLGEPPDASTVAAAAELGWALPQGVVAQQFDDEEHIVHYDLLLVMDKFTAADVLREVSKYDLITQTGNYSAKVRLLGEFHPVLCKRPEPGAQDIDDPLYGNIGGDVEKDAVKASAQLIEQSCIGLAQWLVELRNQQEAGSGAAGPHLSFPSRLKNHVATMKKIEWLVPPMLQPRTPKSDLMFI